MSADAGFKIGKEEAYDEDEKFGFDLDEPCDPDGGPSERDPPPGTGGAGRDGVRDAML